MVRKRKLSRTAFHYIAMAKWGKKLQQHKLIEELNELKLAINKNDIDNIKEELADVELCLPYLRIIYPVRSKFIIENVGKIDFSFAVNILESLIMLKLEEESEVYCLPFAIEAMALYICKALGYIYFIYNIDPKEVDKWKEYKIKRTIERIFTGG